MYSAQLVATGLHFGFYLYKQIVLTAGVFHILHGMTVGYREMLEHTGNFQPIQSEAGFQLFQASGDVVLTAGDEAQTPHSGINFQMACLLYTSRCV